MDYQRATPSLDEDQDLAQSDVRLNVSNAGLQSHKKSVGVLPNNGDEIERGRPVRKNLDLAVHTPHAPQYALRTPPDLHIRTNVGPVSSIASRETPTITATHLENLSHQSAISPDTLPVTTTSLRSTLSAASIASSLSPNSVLASPLLAAMCDITPLPSPLASHDATAIWRHASSSVSRSRSRTSSIGDPTPTRSTPHTFTSPTKKKKAYGNLMQETTKANAAAYQEQRPRTAGSSDVNGNQQHARNRSISDFLPEPLLNNRQRTVTLGHGLKNSQETQYHMQREAHLSGQRGVTISQPEAPLPTPPPSNSSVTDTDEQDETPSYQENGTSTEYLEIHCGIRKQRCKFRPLRQLGQGTFSKVMLATRERIPATASPDLEKTLNPQKLVAIKIIEHGPAGGADQERIEVSLKREIEMLKTVSHPSLIHLKACESQEKRSLLVLTYCPGGDLFELASEQRELLMPNIVRRIFAELVGAVRYLHSQWIVHRDIKLENVLVNLPGTDLAKISDPFTFATPIVTLTDLGLSRRIPEPPESPLLSTRCGSEDYAAPEILLGQPYDGRQTDAWALGVLLYALMEGRLPFDAPPGKPDRSRNTHRIARCDWIWCRFGDQHGEWDPSRAHGFEGPQDCVDGLLKKVRMGRKPLETIAELPWVHGGINVPGGLTMRPEDDDEALS